MRSILVTILLIVVVVGIYQTVFAGDGGMMEQLEHNEKQANERIMNINP